MSKFLDECHAEFKEICLKAYGSFIYGSNPEFELFVMGKVKEKIVKLIEDCDREMTPLGSPDIDKWRKLFGGKKALEELLKELEDK